MLAEFFKDYRNEQKAEEVLLEWKDLELEGQSIIRLSAIFDSASKCLVVPLQVEKNQ